MEQQASNFGLTFTAEHIQSAQTQRDADHIGDAFQLLDDTSHDNVLQSAYLMALRYCFMNDTQSREHAIEELGSLNLPQLSANYRQSLHNTLAAVQIIAMLGDHPAFSNHQPQWIKALSEQVDYLNQPHDKHDLLDVLWLGALNIGAGIVFENETWFAQGEATYKQAITDHIHPEGYLKGIVDDEVVIETYAKQVSGTSALVMMAEMAEHVGVDLWSYDNRGITPITATTYILYYYYYPEKWKWEADLTPEIVEAVIKTDGAFIEIVNRRSKLRVIETLFDFQRPLFCYYAGGLTTLTHGTKPKPKKKGWRLFGA